MLNCIFLSHAMAIDLALQVCTLRAPQGTMEVVKSRWTDGRRDESGRG